MIRIHKENPEILTGSLKYIDRDYNILGYGRFNRKEATIVLVNNNDYEMNRNVSIWQLGIPKECKVKTLMLTHAEGYSTEPKEYASVAGKISVTLPATSALVLKYVGQESFWEKFA